ncbi:MAG: TIGR00645 family protein [Micromonosporaceae bacterium]
MTRRPTGFIGHTMFLSRWLQAPLYLGLILVQAIYVWQFGLELWHLGEKVFAPGGVSETDIVLAVLGLIDIVMIANLLIMIIVGGYETFVSRINLEGHPDRPDWLSHVNENVLKVKLAMAIVGISSIHLLTTFIKASDLGKPGGPTVEAVMWQTIIHTAFLVSALALAYIDKLLHQSRDHAPAPVPVSPAPAGAGDHATSDNHRGGVTTSAT